MLLKTDKATELIRKKISGQHLLLKMIQTDNHETFY